MLRTTLVVIGAVIACALGAYAMLYGGMVMVSAFLPDDEAVANRIALRGLIDFGAGLAAWIGVTVFAVRRYGRARSDRRKTPP